MKIKYQHNILIQAEFGSRFQRESGMGALMAMIKAWSAFYADKHLMNAFEISVDGKEININKYAGPADQ